MADRPLRAAVIGCGAAGSAVARHMASCGIRIGTVCDTELRRARSLARLLKGAEAVGAVQQLRQPADIYVLAVPDDAIGAAVGELRGNPSVPETALAFHMAGAVGVDALNGLHCNTLVMHPVYSFAVGSREFRLPGGLVWELTGAPQAVTRAKLLVRRMKGTPVVLDEEQKVLSHVAGVISCNYLSVLADRAGGIAGKGGQAAQQLLMAQTLANIRKMGPEAALTGPVARGDVKTVARHLDVLKKRRKALVPLYCVLGLDAVALAVRGKKLTRYKAGVLRKLFREGMGG